MHGPTLRRGRSIREQVAWALYDKALALGEERGQIEEAVAACDELIVRFGDETGRAPRSLVGWALYKRIVWFRELGLDDENAPEQLIERRD